MELNNIKFPGKWNLLRNKDVSMKQNCSEMQNLSPKPPV